MPKTPKKTHSELSLEKLLGEAGVPSDSELSESVRERRFRALIEQSPVSFQIFAPDGTTLLVNRAWERLWKASSKEVAGYNILRDQQLQSKGVMPQIKRAFAGERVEIPPVYYDPAVIGKPGRPRWIHAHMYPVKDEKGSLREVVLVHLDVTDQKAAEEKLRVLLEREHEVRREAQQALDIHATMLDGLMLSDRNHRVTFTNPRAEELLGVRKSQVGVDPSEIHRDFRKFFKYEVEPLFDVRGAQRRVLRGEGGRGLLRIRSKPVRLVEVSYSPWRDEEGRVKGGITTIRDVTELVTQKERVEVIYQTMRDGIIVFGATGVITQANPAAIEMFGLKKSPVGMKREAFLQSRGRRHRLELLYDPEQAFRKCLRQGVVTFGKKIVHAPGEDRHIDIVYAPLKDQTGKPVGVIATYRDMTRMVEKEEQTKRYLDSLEILFESSNLFSSTLNMNEIMRLIIRQVRKLVPDILECYIGLVKGDDLMLRAAYGLSRQGSRLMGVDEGVEGWVIRRGRHRLVRNAPREKLIVEIPGREHTIGSLLCLPLRVGDEVIGTLTIGLDDAEAFNDELIKALLILTSRAAMAIDHARAYEYAIKERSRWEAVVHHSGEGIATINRTGQILYWNPALERITGYSAGEVLGRNIAEVFPEDEIGNLPRLEKETEFETPIATRSGGEKWVSITSSQIREEWTEQPQVRNVIVMVRDITRLKEIEAKKSEFVSIASHELRTPLTAIKGYLSMLIEEDAGELNTNQLMFLDRIYRSTDRLVNLVEDLLSVSRIEENRLSVRPRAVDMREVLDGLMHELDYRALEKSVTIEITSTHLPPVLADPGHLRQILFNLVDNAIKYTSAHGEIRVSFRRRRGNLITEVTDTGVGIPEDQLPKLFEKFERVNNPLSVRAGGSGLGLFITKNLIERQGGKIWVKSEFKKGSTFSFSLPIYQEDLRLFKIT